jgi:hypothetical protein
LYKYYTNSLPVAGLSQALPQEAKAALQAVTVTVYAPSTASIAAPPATLGVEPNPTVTIFLPASTQAAASAAPELAESISCQATKDSPTVGDCLIAYSGFVDLLKQYRCKSKVTGPTSANLSTHGSCTLQGWNADGDAKCFKTSDLEEARIKMATCAKRIGLSMHTGATWTKGNQGLRFVSSGKK